LLDTRNQDCTPADPCLECQGVSYSSLQLFFCLL
jgi:hypothetical protein